MIQAEHTQSSVSTVKTTRRSTVQAIAATNSKLQKEAKPGTVGINESDSNADTCCLGINFIVLSYTNRTADVYPYDDSYSPAYNIPIVTGATAFDHEDGQTYILVFHESLYYGTRLKHSLINPNQVRGLGWATPIGIYG